MAGYPPGVSATDVNFAIPVVTAAITRCSLGGGAANPGLQSTLAQALGALGDMIASNGNTALYTPAQWQSFAAAMQTMQAMAAANGDGATANAFACCSQIFNTL